MSRQIDLGKKLSDRDRAYLEMYNQHHVLEALDRGETPQPQMSGMTTATLTGEEPPSPNANAGGEGDADPGTKPASTSGTTKPADKK